VPEAFALGAVAGYAIAIPVGPIALLIIRTGLSRGLAAAAAAGAGTATADLLYALAAMLFGAAASELLAPVLPAIRILAALALAAVAVRALIARAAPAEMPTGSGIANPYLSFLGLTLLNPPTVIYFVSLALALPEVSRDLGSRLAFVTGAFLASLSWQELLAVAGALLHGRLGPGLQRATTIVSSVVILAFAVRIALG
jgi:threonine/homoserine/homoserine lactone efflux protein